jgi:eukaryotic-like serine/threonine-protein kinase
VALIPGTRLGPYEIAAQIGKGGMGEVYRASDTNLGRGVAIKVLPDAFAHDPERLARFEREAKTLASLNHPNIAIIHGLEKTDGLSALVMELVDGPTLADRIARGPIALDEALPIAKQIAAALEAAHEQGIVHRDLKPANVKVRTDGTVKVLDFGLAKAIETGPTTVDASQSPTITSPALMTGLGGLLGTAAYMAPEQARGKLVDKRVDIWAFAAVVYEMLTGQRAFDGEDVSMTLAAVMKGEPDWNALPPDVSSGMTTVLKRCLHKDPSQRLRDIRDVRLALEGAFDSPSLAGTPATVTRSPARRAMPWLAGTLACTATGLAIWLVRPEPVAPIGRFEMALSNLSSFNGPNFTLSRDGQSLVYAEVIARGQSRLMRRDLTKVQPESIPGSEGAETAPFFSPDGAWIGFVTNRGRAIRKVPTGGGAAVTICEAAMSIYTPIWPADDTIIFGTNSGLWRVPAAGGAPEPVTKTERAAGGPQALPDGRGTLFHVNPPAGSQTEGSIEVLLPTGERRAVVQGMNPYYVPTGHLLFARLGGSLWAAPFDLETLAISRDPIPLPDSAFTRGFAPSELAFAANGSLVYLPDAVSGDVPLVWVDRTGVWKPAFPDAGRYAFPRLSPDGKRIAIGNASDVWVFDVERLTRTRLSYGDRGAVPAVTAWPPDGRHVVFAQRTRDASTPGTTIVLRRADASEPPEVLVVLDGLSQPGSWSTDGKVFVYAHRANAMTDNWDVSTLARGATQARASFLSSPFAERAPTISPGGRWVAYVSNESGRDEIYASPYPGPGDRRTVSRGGGTEPVWSRDGRELFYRNGDAMMAVPVKDPASLALGQPVTLFEWPLGRAAPAAPNYDVSLDGRTFLMVQQAAMATSSVVIVINWFEELKRLVPTN